MWMLVGVCCRKNMKWVGSADSLSIYLCWQQVNEASCWQHFFPVCTEAFNPCKTCTAEAGCDAGMGWPPSRFASCAETPSFAIMNTLFNIALVREGWICSVWFIDHTKTFHLQKPHLVCLVLPISKHFIVSEGVNSGMMVFFTHCDAGELLL